jgi:hypothetical protein
MKWEECKHMRKRPAGKDNIRWCNIRNWCVRGKDSGDRCNGCTKQEKR